MSGRTCPNHRTAVQTPEEARALVAWLRAALSPGMCAEVAAAAAAVARTGGDCPRASKAGRLCDEAWKESQR
jgi:hypothetical protein